MRSDLRRWQIVILLVFVMSDGRTRALQRGMCHTHVVDRQNDAWIGCGDGAVAAAAWTACPTSVMAPIDREMIRRSCATRRHNVRINVDDATLWRMCLWQPWCLTQHHLPSPSPSTGDNGRDNETASNNENHLLLECHRRRHLCSSFYSTVYRI